MLNEQMLEDAAAGKLIGWSTAAISAAKELIALRTSHEELRKALLVAQFFNNGLCGVCGGNSATGHGLSCDVGRALANAQKVRS